MGIARVTVTVFMRLTYIHNHASPYSFTIAADPRGNTLGRGTQVILHLRDEAVREFAKQDKLKKVLIKYSEFVNFPIYLEMDKTIEVEEPLPAEEIAKLEAERDEKLAKKAAEKEEKKEGDDATVEDVEDKSDEEEDEEKFKTTRTVTKDVTEWERMNPHKPIWTRDAKDVSEEEYHSFYKTFNKKDTEAPLAYAHFKAEGENEFRSMLFIPTKGPTNHLQSADLHLRAVI